MSLHFLIWRPAPSSLTSHFRALLSEGPRMAHRCLYCSPCLGKLLLLHAAPSLLLSAQSALSFNFWVKCHLFDEAASDPLRQKQLPTLQDSPGTCLHVLWRSPASSTWMALLLRDFLPGALSLSRSAATFTCSVSQGADSLRFSVTVCSMGKAQG